MIYPASDQDVVLVVNVYPDCPETTLDSVRAWAPPSWMVLRVALCCDVASTTGYDVLLGRDCALDGMSRHLPYVKNMLNVGRFHTSAWVGIANADLQFTEGFFTRFAEVEARVKAIAVHRRDVDDMGRVAEATVWKSMDACFVRRQLWNAHRDSFPDFIFGAPAWDIGFKAWCLAGGWATAEIAGEEVLHRTHMGTWRKPAYENTDGAYNRKLFQAQMVEVVRRRIEPGLHIDRCYWSPIGGGLGS